MICMELSKIVITESSDCQVIWLREKGGQRTFPILIGIVEAAAIDRAIREIGTPRPLTHDLLADVITSMGATLERIVVNSLQRTTFYAKLVLRLDSNVIEVDARPSDAVAIAVRLNAPIFVEDEVLDHCCSDSKSSGGDENTGNGPATV